jgi:hypothetical protein
MGPGAPLEIFSGECKGNIVPARPTIDQTKPGAALWFSPALFLMLMCRAFYCRRCFWVGPDIRARRRTSGGTTTAGQSECGGQPETAAAAVSGACFNQPPRAKLTLTQTFGEMTMEQKAKISHRGKALEKLLARLLQLA